jgi:hypothetical protein
MPDVQIGSTNGRGSYSHQNRSWFQLGQIKRSQLEWFAGTGEYLRSCLANQRKALTRFQMLVE